MFVMMLTFLDVYAGTSIEATSDDGRTSPSTLLIFFIPPFPFVDSNRPGPKFVVLWNFPIFILNLLVPFFLLYNRVSTLISLIMHGFALHHNTDSNRQLESSAEWKNTKPNRQISQIPPSRAAAAAQASQQCKCGKKRDGKMQNYIKKSIFYSIQLQDKVWD